MTLPRKLSLRQLQKLAPYNCFKTSPLVFTVMVAVVLLALTGFKTICRTDWVQFVSLIIHAI